MGFLCTVVLVLCNAGCNLNSETVAEIFLHVQRMCSVWLSCPLM
jgi:hypothetical protein